jgi:hypothetical protein
MATQGRRSGSRHKRTDDAGSNAAGSTTAIEAIAPPPVATNAEPAAELLEEQSAPILGGRGLRFGRPLVSGIAATVLVAGLAFGAALGPGGALAPKDGAGAGIAALHDGGESSGSAHDGGRQGDDASGWGGQDGVGPDGTEAPDETGGAEPTDKPEPEPTSKPEPRHDPKPDPDPDPDPDPTREPAAAVSLSVWIKELHPKLEWGSCDGVAFDYYKVVRSKDSTVTWPLGDNDTLIAVVERGGERRAYDGDAPHGRKVWYRVFCVRHTDAGYKVLNASNARGIEVPEEPAPPDPVALDIEFSFNAEGEVVLSWGTCGVDGFGFYKVLRSTWNENPSYLPWTDGTEVIGVVENKYATEWHDAGGDPGQTVYYRVQCLGWINGSKVLLGETAVVAVTMP